MEGLSHSSGKRCAVVTGGNKGIGFEICRQLASHGVFVILTSRDEKSGTEAVQILKESGLSDVVYHQLDITELSCISSLSNFVSTIFKKLDILVNNAGDIGVEINADAFRAFPLGFLGVRDGNPEILKGIIEQTSERAEACLKTNYYGTKAITESLLPLLQLSNSPNIVNVTAKFGELTYIPSEKVREELNNVESLSEERLDAILQGFLKDFREGKLEANGWPKTISAYKISKACIHAYSRMLARNLPNMRINCIHPGYVKTDITCHTGFLTAAKGAKGAVMLALFDVDGPSGQYFDEMEVSVF